MIKRVREQLEGQGIGLELTQAAKFCWPTRATTRRWAPARCAGPSSNIEDPLSERILWKEFRAGETIIVDAEDDEIVFRSIAGLEPPPVELAGAGQE